jgi:phosphoglycolate phosphatase-like HAD superfamily hydrolase
MKPKSLIVFDMDGVIIDVSRSYRDTVRQTARLFFKGAVSWQDLPDPLFTLVDLAEVKQSGGLNNDWDLTFLVINLLSTFIKQPADNNEPDPWTRYRTTVSRCNVADLARFLTSSIRPITTLFKKNGHIRYEWISDFYVGDVGSGNIIKQIFQEIYLGKDLFESTYGFRSQAYTNEGYINREKCLIKRSVLEDLSNNHILAIATGRPMAEADYPLDLFDLRKYFTHTYTLDDCIKEEQKIKHTENKTASLSKPHPFMLDAIYEQQKDKTLTCYYLGDMPDDMIAASRSRAKFTGIGILIASSDKGVLKKNLLRAGADYVIDDFDELETIVKLEN